MASPAAVSSRDTTAPPHGGWRRSSQRRSSRRNTLVEKALTASKSGRYALAAGFYRRAVEEGFDSTERRLCAPSLHCGALRRGVVREEEAALCAEAWTLVSRCLPLLVRCMNDNTMLPGRGTAVELAFFKRFTAILHARYNSPPWSTRRLQLFGLSLGDATTLLAADVLLGLLFARNNDDTQAFILRVVDSMLPAAQSLADTTLGEELNFASTVQYALSGASPTYDAALVASLRAKWTAAAMVQMCRERRLLDASEKIQERVEAGKTRWRADFAEHGLKRCALPSCDKLEAPVQQYFVPRVAPCGTAPRSTGRSTSRSAAQPRPRSRLRMTRARAPRDAGTAEALRTRVCVVRRRRGNGRALCALRRHAA